MKNLVVSQLQKVFKEDCFYRLDYVLGVEFKESRPDTDLLVKTISVSFSRVQGFESIEQLRFYSIQKGIWAIPLSDEAPVIVSVDLTLLKLMMPGSIWKNGGQVFSPDSKYSLELDTRHSILTSLSVEAPGFHPQKANDIKLVKVEGSKINGSPVTVLIPTVELIRYFYATSNTLVSHLFNMPDAADSLVKQFDIDDVNQSMKLRMDRTLKKVDARVMALAAFDQGARGSINRIYSSITQEQILNTERRILCPSSDFPFKGAAGLQVDGQLLSSTSKEDVFLVTRIKDCDYQYPLKLIELEGMNQFKFSSSLHGCNKQEQDEGQKDCFEEKSQLSLELTVDERPGSRRLRESLTGIDDLYSGAKGVQVMHLRERGVSMRPVSYLNVAKPNPRKLTNEKIDSVACSTLPGSCSAGNPVFGVRFGEEYVSNLQDMNQHNEVKQVFEVIESLQDYLPGFKAEFITNEGSSEQLGFYEFSSATSSWGVIDGRPRKAIFLKLSFKSICVYLLEMDRNKWERFALYVFAMPVEMESFNEQQFLSSVARVSGKNLAISVFQKYFKFYNRIYHSAIGYEYSYKWRVMTRIKELLLWKLA